MLLLCFFYQKDKVKLLKYYLEQEIGIASYEPLLELLWERIWKRRPRTATISTFYFFTIYTKVPYNNLLFVLNESIDFKVGPTIKFILQRPGLHWISRKSKKGLQFTKENIKETLKYLMDNFHFTQVRRSSVRSLV